MKARTVGVLLLIAAATAVAVLVRGRGEPRSGPGVIPAPAPPPPAGVGGPVEPSSPRPSPWGAAPSERFEVRPDQDAPFRWDDGKPLIEQVRGMLEAVHFDAGMVRAWRARGDEVAAAVVALLKDPATTRNPREMGIAILEDLKRPSTLPSVLAVARGDADEDVRVHAIRALGAFRGVVKEAELRGLFEGAPTAAEKGMVVDVLGELGEAASLPFLETTAKSTPDGLVATAAGEALRKVRILSSAKPEVELVQILHEEGHRLRDWALGRIVEGKKVEVAHHLRQVLAEQRKLPKERTSASFQYHLLRGLEELGQALSAAEKAFVEGYGRGEPVRPPE